MWRVSRCRGGTRSLWATRVQAEANANLGPMRLGRPPMFSVYPCIFHIRARTHHPSSRVTVLKCTSSRVTVLFMPPLWNAHYTLGVLLSSQMACWGRECHPQLVTLLRQQESEKLRNQVRHRTAFHSSTQEAQVGELGV